MAIDSFHTSGHSPGPDFDKPTAIFPTASRCRVGLLGFGTVASAAARRLVSHAVRGLDLTHNTMSNAEFADHAENVSPCIDRCLEAEAV